MNLGYPFEVSEVEDWRAMLIALGIAPNSIEKTVFRIIGSGMNKLATKTGGTILDGDVSVELATLNILPKDILIECKHHKSRTRAEKSFSVKKMWLDQALHEAQKNGRFSLIAIKFKSISPNSTELKKYCWADGHFGNSTHYVIPQHHFFELIEYIASIKNKSVNTNSKEIDISTISTSDLIEELKKRVK